MVSVFLPSDALLQYLPSYLGISYLGCGVSLHGCSSKAQPLLLTLDEGYLLTAAPPDLECGVAPFGLLRIRCPQCAGIAGEESQHSCEHVFRGLTQALCVLMLSHTHLVSILTILIIFCNYEAL